MNRKISEDEDIETGGEETNIEVPAVLDPVMIPLPEEEDMFLDVNPENILEPTAVDQASNQNKPVAESAENPTVVEKGNISFRDIRKNTTIKFRQDGEWKVGEVVSRVRVTWSMSYLEYELPGVRVTWSMSYLELRVTWSTSYLE